MKNFYFTLIIALFFLACSDDDDSTPIIEEEISIYGEWNLDYLISENQRWDPSLICNGYTELTVEIIEIPNENFDGRIQAESACNTFWADRMQVNENQLVLSFLASTLTDCAPIYTVENCELDGSEFESILYAIWTNSSWDDENLVNYTLQNFDEIDTLKIQNDANQVAVYWRNSLE